MEYFFTSPIEIREIQRGRRRKWVHVDVNVENGDVYVENEYCQYIRDDILYALVRVPFLKKYNLERFLREEDKYISELKRRFSEAKSPEEFTFEELYRLLEYHVYSYSLEDAKDVASFIDEKSGYTDIRSLIAEGESRLSDALSEASRLSEEERSGE
ncbi:MAG: hypothetical protein QXS21_05895 [Thermoproteota archaeon]